MLPAAVRSGKFTEPPVNGKLYTEEDWNNTSTLLGEPYNLSKVLVPDIVTVPAVFAVMLLDAVLH